MRQDHEDHAGHSLPSLTDLLARYVSDQSERVHQGGLAVDPGGEIDLHDAGAATQAVDPRLAWDEAVAALQAGPKAELPKPRAIPDWNGLVSAQEPALDLPFCVGNFPQMVRNLGLLLQDEAMGTDGAKTRPFQSPALVRWAEEAVDRPFPQPLLAIGLLRLAHEFERAARLLKAHAGQVPAEWQAAWRNEEAALLWESGKRESALSLWAREDQYVPSLFNRGMAALFLGRPADALAPLRQVVARLPESSSWHHLAQLYLTLAEMRQ